MPVFVAEVVVQGMRYHLVVAALRGEEFACVVVAEAVIVRHLHASFAGGHDLRQEILGVEIGRLDEDGFRGVAECGCECLILRRVETVFVWCPPGLTTDHGDGEDFVTGCWDQRGHRIGGLDVGVGSLCVRLDGGVEQAADCVDPRFSGPRVQTCCGAQDFGLDVWVVVWILGGVLGKVGSGAFLGDVF